MSRWKSKLKAAAPVGMTFAAKSMLQERRIKAAGVREALAAAEPATSKLGLDALRKLAEEFPPPENLVWQGTEWKDQSAQLARERVQWMRKVLGSRLRSGMKCMEVGAGDAAVAAALQQTGVEVLAVDMQRDVFDESPEYAHIDFLEADAAQLDGVEDDRFDLVYSFDSLEHMSDPEGALREALRVTRPGGLVYLRFGPLYYAPDGKHLGDRLGIPYAAVLFDDSTIDEHMLAQGRDAINHDYCNGLPLNTYRELLRAGTMGSKRIFYYEHQDLSAISLIPRFAEVFRHTSDQADEFLVNVLEVLLQKPR